LFILKIKKRESEEDDVQAEVEANKLCWCQRSRDDHTIKSKNINEKWNIDEHTSNELIASDDYGPKDLTKGDPKVSFG